MAVEPRYNEGPRNWKNLFAIRGGFVISRLIFIYFAITGVKKIVRYIEDFLTKGFVITRFHCDFSGPKSNIQIRIKRIRARVLASKLLHFVSLTDGFILLDAKILKPLSCWKKQQLY